MFSRLLAAVDRVVQASLCADEIFFAKLAPCDAGCNLRQTGLLVSGVLTDRPLVRAIIALLCAGPGRGAADESDGGKQDGTGEQERGDEFHLGISLV